MPRSVWLACGALMTAIPAIASAQLAFPSRISSTKIDTAAKDFSDVTATITATTTVAPDASGSRNLDFYASSNLNSLTTRATGDVALFAQVVYTDPDNGYSEIAGSVTATGPRGGSFSFVEHYGRDSEPTGFGPLYRYADGSVYHDPNYGFLPAFTNSDLPSIEFFLPIGGAGLVDPAGSFVAELLIAGDYSSTAGLASGIGQHYLAHLNPAWKITSDFVYDPLTNLTTFRAEQTPYDYNSEGDFGLELDAFFFGSAATAVPEPATWATMTLGLLLVGAMLRRRGATLTVQASA